MNNVSLIGRLTKDTVLTKSKEGKSIFKNCIAVNRTREITDFINVIAFGKTAELIAEYHKKGDMVAVVGSIWTGSYEKDGEKKYTFEVCVNQLTFINNKKVEVAEDDSDFFPFE